MKPKYNWAKELQALSKILDQSNENFYAKDFNLTPMLSLNCSHITDDADGINKELQFEESIDCSVLDHVKFAPVGIQESLTSDSESCTNPRRRCIQGRFKDILYEHYQPIETPEIISNPNEATNIFFWKQIDSCCDISPSDFDSIAFRRAEDDSDNYFQAMSALQDVPVLPEPLFLRLACAAEINGSQFCEISLGPKLPTCLKDIFLNVYNQVKDQISEEGSNVESDWLRKIGAPLKIEKLRVCIKFYFLHLPPKENCFNVVNDFVGASRVRTSSSVYEYIPNSNNADSFYSADLDTSDIPNHVPSQERFLARMKWLISDVVATCLHDTGSANLLGIQVHEKIKKHVKEYESRHSNSDFRELILKFVEKDAASFDLLEKELEKFEWKNFKICSLGANKLMYSLFVDPEASLKSSKNKILLKRRREVKTQIKNEASSGNTSEVGCDCCHDYGGFVASSNQEVSEMDKSDSTRSLTVSEKVESGSKRSWTGGVLEDNDKSLLETDFMKEFEECLHQDNPMLTSSLEDVRPAENDTLGVPQVNTNVQGENKFDESFDDERVDTLKLCCDYDGDTSNNMDSTSSQGDTVDIFRPKAENFWMVFELETTPKVYICRIYLHKPFCCENDVSACCSDPAFQEFEKYVHKSVHKVNQIKLLDHFYEHEQSLPILLNYTGERGGSIEPVVDWRELMLTADFTEWDPDEFKCDEVKRIEIPIHVRIQPANPKSGSENVSTAVLNVFAKRGIKTARIPPAVSLYKTDEGDVFYLKCAIEDNTSSKKSTGGGKLSDSGTRYGEVFQSSQTLSYSSPRIKYSLVVSVFGVGQLDCFLKVDLKNQLEASLRDRTLSQLWTAFLQSQCKLYTADVELLQSRNVTPNVYVFEIPTEFYGYLYHFMWHLQSNLNLYTVEPKYWNVEEHEFHFKGLNGESCQSVNCRLFVNVKDESYLLRSNPLSSKPLRSRSDPGFALLEFSIISPTEDKRNRSFRLNTDDLNMFSDEANLPFCEIVEKDSMKDDKYYIRFCVWETGKIDREKLLNKVVESCITQALCDVYIEYKLLNQAPVGVDGPGAKDVNHVDLLSLPPESYLHHHHHASSVDKIAFYLNQVFPWLIKSREQSSCMSVITHKCSINFRQRLSEFFFSVQNAIKQDNKGTEFVWLLYRNKNGHLHKIRDQSLTKALNCGEMGLDFPELVLPPQTDLAEYYFLAFNPNEWSFTGRSRHASGNSESKFSVARHQVVHVPKDIFVDTVNRRSVIIGKFQNRELFSVAYNISSVNNFFSHFDERAQSMNFDSRILNCIVRQKMGIFNHKCFTDIIKRTSRNRNQQRTIAFQEKFKEHRVALDPKIDVSKADDVMRQQPNIYSKIIAAQEKVNFSKATRLGQIFTPKVKISFVEALKQFAHTYEYGRTKRHIRDYLKKFENNVEQKIDSLAVNRDELELILSRSRLYHYVTTPMFFASSWHKLQAQNSNTMQVPSESDFQANKLSNTWYDDRKEEIMDGFSRRFESKIQLQITQHNPNMSHTSRVKHQSGNYPLHQQSSQLLFFPGPRNVPASSFKFARYFVRSVNYGGVAVIKYGFYINEYDCFFCVQLNTFLFRRSSTRGANSFELFDDYYQKLDYLVQNLHVHSFAYDLQLRMAWTYILEKNRLNSAIAYPELESSQKNVLNFLKDFITFHHSKAPSSSIKRLLSKEIRVSLGVGDDIDPKQFYEYLVDRRQLYNIACFSVPGSMGKTGLENTTLITQSYDVKASQSSLSFSVGELKCTLLFAHDSFEKTEHKHRKQAWPICDEQLCCKYDLGKTGKEKFLVIKYYLILSSEIIEAPNVLLDPFKPNLRAEERRKFNKIEQDRSKYLNDMLQEQDKLCTCQIKRVLDRVKKDFHRDLLLSKIVDCSTSPKMETSSSFPVEPQPPSRGQTFSVFNSSDTKKKSSASLSAVFTQSHIFQSCLNEKESLMLLDFFFPISIEAFLREAQARFFDVKEPDLKAADTFAAKFSSLIKLIVPKIDEFLAALSKMASVHVLNFSTKDLNSSVGEFGLEFTENDLFDNQPDTDSISGSGEQCALVFRKSTTCQYKSLPCIPEFLVLIARSGNLPRTVLQKLKTSETTDNTMSFESSQNRVDIDSKIMIVSTNSLRTNKKLYSSENIEFIQNIYSFMIYFSYLN